MAEMFSFTYIWSKVDENVYWIYFYSLKKLAFLWAKLVSWSEFVSDPKEDCFTRYLSKKLGTYNLCNLKFYGKNRELRKINEQIDVQKYNKNKHSTLIIILVPNKQGKFFKYKKLKCLN